MHSAGTQLSIVMPRMNLLLMKDHEINSGYDPELNSYTTITLSSSNLVLTLSDHGNEETIADMIRIQYIRNFKYKTR
jgi:hypothetical protein